MDALELRYVVYRHFVEIGSATCTPPTVETAQQLLDQAGLTGRFWQLRP